MKKISLFLPLVLICLFGFALRFYQFGSAPAGVYIDEAGQGYNALSLLKTQKDEFGKRFPIVFRQFTDFKTPTYIYLLVPLVQIFGLSPFSVRLPSLLFGIFTFPVVYFLALELLPKTIEKRQAIAIASLSTLLLSISPWHILFTRTDFETSVALFFYLLGIYLFYLGIKKPFWLITSALAFSIAIPSYHAERFLVPLTLIVLFWRHKHIITSKTHRPYILLGSLIGIFVSLPSLMVTLTPGFLARVAGLNIFNNSHLPAGYLSGAPSNLSLLINHPFFLSTKEFLSLYFSYFSPRNMFLLGDYGLRSSYPQLATFFTWQLPFYISGLYQLLRQKKLKELRFIIIFLLLLSPIPAAITRDPYSSIRALPLVVPQCVVIALGILSLFKLLKNNLLRLSALVGLTFALIYSVLNLYSSVIILNEHYRASFWDYGWADVASVLKSIDPTKPVVVDNSRSEPYIELLFFLKFDPSTYQSQNFEILLSEYYTNMNRNLNKKIGNIATRSIDWKTDSFIDQYLVGDQLAISTDQLVNNHLTLISEIKFPDKSVAFRIVKTNPEELRVSNLSRN